MNQLNFAFDPQLPLWFIIAVAILVALMSVWSIIRKVRGALIRTLAGLLLLLALLNPSLLEEEREPLKNVVAVVVDKTGSQQIDGRAEETETARKALMEDLAKYDQFEVREVDTTDFVSDTTDVSSALFQSAKYALQDVPGDRVGGVIMITDGQVHDIPENYAQLGIKAPLHAFITGRENEKDRRIVITNLPKYGVVNESHEIRYRVEETGFNPPSTFLDVTISLDGEPISVEKVAPGEEASFVFDIPHGGKNIIELAVEADPEEITEINNRTFSRINGIRENLRVLLVSGEPHAGERTWRNLLKADASVDLVHFTILRPPEKQDGTPISQLSLIAFPTRELFVEKIDQFDLIIFDRYSRRGVLPLLYFDNIARYVQDGGAVFVAAGPEYADINSIGQTPLQRILPAQASGQVFEKPYRPRLSELGNKHPVTRKLPGSSIDGKTPDWSHWFRAIGAGTTTGQTVMVDESENPLLILERVGEGRVAMMLSDHAWLWARNFEGGGPYLPLLRRTVHWLMKEPELDEERLFGSSQGKEITISRQTLKDKVGPLELTAPNGKTSTHELKMDPDGIWSVTLPVNDIGLYQAANDTFTTLVQVGPANPREFAEVISTTAKLQPVANESKGSVTRLADGGIPKILPVAANANTVGRGWIGLYDNHASRLIGIDRISLFVGLTGLLLLLAAFVATWLREGRAR